MSDIVRSQVIGEYQGFDASMAARRENREIEKEIQRKRKRWRILPPENMRLSLHESLGAFPADLVISVPHEIGRYLLGRKLAAIVERDVDTDAVIEGDLEEAIDAMNL